MKIQLTGLFEPLQRNDILAFLERQCWLYEPLFDFWQKDERRFKFKDPMDDGGRDFIIRYALEENVDEATAHKIFMHSLDRMADLAKLLKQGPVIKPDGSIEFEGQTFALKSWNETRPDVDDSDAMSSENWESEHFTIEVDSDGVSVHIHSKAAASWNPDRMTWKTFQFPNSSQADNFEGNARVLLRSIFEFARVAEFPPEKTSSNYWSSLDVSAPQEGRGWTPE